MNPPPKKASLPLPPISTQLMSPSTPTDEAARRLPIVAEGAAEREAISATAVVEAERVNEGAGVLRINIRRFLSGLVALL